MIKSLKYKNFKSLKDVSVELKNLNIITGINGVGKSSLIQGILLLRQSYLKNQLTTGISLDGELTGNLGNIQDIENKQSASGFIEISIDECNLRFDTSDKREDTVLRGEIDISSIVNNPIFSTSKFQYISASRISPESQFKKDTHSIENKQFGRTGEFAIAYISEYGKKKYDNDSNLEYRSLINLALGEKQEILPLENQINHWLNFVANNVRLNITKTTSIKYELNFEFFNGLSWDSYSASNSAFGLTYSLPIITALLSAAPGDLVILENPESDLHPRAQSKLGELISRCANAGVQIIVETHSDHILNGIRVAISNKPTLLPNDQVKILYFYKEDNNSFTTVREIEIDQNGRMPIKELKIAGIDGFFDQIDTDYKKLYENLNG